MFRFHWAGSGINSTFATFFSCLCICGLAKSNYHLRQISQKFNVDKKCWNYNFFPFYSRHLTLSLVVSSSSRYVPVYFGFFVYINDEEEAARITKIGASKQEESNGNRAKLMKWVLVNLFFWFFSLHRLRQEWTFAWHLFLHFDSLLVILVECCF